MSSADITNTQFSLLPDLLLVLDSLQAKDASLAIKQVWLHINIYIYRKYVDHPLIFRDCSLLRSKRSVKKLNLNSRSSRAWI